MRAGPAVARTVAAPPRLDAAVPNRDAAADAVLATSAVVTDPDDAAAYIYNPQVLRTYELLLAQADLDTLNADPAAEQYVPGMLRFEGHEYGPVGIRYKGSVGAFVRCVGFSAGARPMGPKKCRKLSIKVGFDFVDPERHFYGLKKLQFHAMANDASLMRERLGYDLFREMGVPAPRAVHARLLINGALEGVFVLVEQIDGRFTRSHLSDGGEGNLYKEVWPMHDTEQTYLDALETNEDQAPSVARMLAFARALEAADGDTIARAIETYVDRDAILSYLAVDRSIRHEDGPLAFYCDSPAGQGANPGAYGNHNYYWYEETLAGRFWIIPWDLDLAFNGLGFAGQMETVWYEPLDGMACECPARMQGRSFMSPKRPAACDKLVQGLALMRDGYRARVGAFVDGPFGRESVSAKLDAWSAQIADLVAEQAQDPQQPSVEAWQSGLTNLHSALESLQAAASAERDAK
jgi:spore coat protein CotH